MVLDCALSGGGAAGCTTGSYSRSIYYAHNDHLGTPHMLSDENGIAVWRAVYEPFGLAALNEDPDNNGESVVLNMRFPGQYYDSESGLYYNYFRYYDPETGRYITSDPIGLDGGLNTYSYAHSNPIELIDPLGLWSVSVQAYGGPGGAVKITYNNGTLEATGRIGVGLGAGIEFNPTAEPSPHSKDCGNGYIARTTVEIGVNYGLGVVGAGAGFVGASGNAVTHKVGGGYAEVGGPQIATTGNASFGFSATANVGVDIGSYSNW